VLVRTGVAVELAFVACGVAVEFALPARFTFPFRLRFPGRLVFPFALPLVLRLVVFFFSLFAFVFELSAGLLSCLLALAASALEFVAGELSPFADGRLMSTATV